jgi:hypothetical protein
MFRVTTARWMRRLLAIAALAALGACEQPRPTELPVNPALDGLSSSGPALVECPTSETTTASTQVVDASVDYTVAIGGTKVVIPAGAVVSGTVVELAIPASRYVEIGITANGGEHLELDLPITVAIDYSRCRRSDVLTKPLQAWYIDAATKQLIAPMVGVDNKLERAVTFTTPHNSGYAIAF